jgi:hypothetical protein
MHAGDIHARALRLFGSDKTLKRDSSMFDGFVNGMWRWRRCGVGIWNAALASM